METKTKQKRQSVTHADYSTTANCHTKIPVIFRRIFEIFRSISKCLYMYSTNSLGTPNDVQCNPGWQTLIYTELTSFTSRPLYCRGKIPGTHCTGDWVGPRAGLNGVDKRKISCYYRVSKPIPQSPRLGTILTAKVHNTCH